MNSRALACVLGVALIAGTASAQSTQAVEWKVSEGGNGHWYQWVKVPSGLTWTEAQNLCLARNGYLATSTAVAENTFLFNLTLPTSAWQNRFGPWLGGFQAANSSEPDGGWQWVSGETWSWTAWWSWEPSNSYCERIPEDRLHFIDYEPKWNDITDAAGGCDGVVWSYLIEWSADCNGDGIVDYGQIKNGQLEDDNGDGIPDVCQYTVTGVIPVSGASAGGTAITVKGTSFPENPAVLIGGVPATDVVRVSATRITATTPAGLPGMTSVTVGNWFQPNAFYYRPECGSDLDQDGEVTAADIAIVLLDFGPCYVSAAPNPPEDSRPFMLREEAAPVAPRSR